MTKTAPMQFIYKSKIVALISASFLLLASASLEVNALPVSSYITLLTPVANAGLDQSVCGLSMNLNGNNASPAIGTWSLISGPGTATFSNTHARNSNVAVSGAGTYTFQWSITDVNGTTTDQVSITFYSSATTANAGPDQIVCGTNATLVVIYR